MSVLTKITAEAKRIRKAHPRKYDRLSNPWSGGYVKEAAKNVKRCKVTKPGKKKRKPTARKAVKRVSSKRKTVKRKRAKRKVVVTKSVTRSVGSRRRRRSRTVSGTSRRRSVGKKSNTGLILGIGALALGAVYLMTRDNKKGITYQGEYLPPLQPTGNNVRDQQSNSVLHWALAGGIAINAIAALVDRLNSGSDQEVDSIYKDVSTRDGAGVWV